MTPVPRLKYPLESIRVEGRIRRDLGDLTSLKDSMRAQGLIQPIVIDQHGNLIAGGRRYTAGRELGWKEIDVVFKEVLDETHLRELEVMENVERKDFTWQERVLAIAKIHSLKTDDPEWGLRETGRLLNMSLGKVSYMLQVARALNSSADHKVWKAESVTDAIRILMQSQEDDMKAELAKRLATKAATSSSVAKDVAALTGKLTETRSPSPSGVDEKELIIPLTQIFRRGDATKLSEYFPVSSVDHIITDPPYATDMSMLDQNNPHGGMSDIARIEETHQVDSNLQMLEAFVPEAFKVLKPTGFLVMWCDVMRWQFLYDVCVRTGFRVQRWPITWVKTHPCMNQSAQANFTKNTEIAIVCRMPKATIAVPATSCVVAASNEAKVDSHPFAKPSAVWEFIYRHVSIEGQSILDPFAGSCSALRPALRMKRLPIGLELDEKHFNTGQATLRAEFAVLYPNTKLSFV